MNSTSCSEKLISERPEYLFVQWCRGSIDQVAPVASAPGRDGGVRLGHLRKFFDTPRRLAVIPFVLDSTDAADRAAIHSETVRKHIVNQHNETMPPSMYEYFRGAVWQRKKLP